jgi:hypothetical protein
MDWYGIRSYVTVSVNNDFDMLLMFKNVIDVKSDKKIKTYTFEDS